MKTEKANFRTAAKRTLAILLMLLLLFTAFPAPLLPVNAETTDGFYYDVNNGEATITDYIGSATELVVPSVLDGYPVTKIGEFAFSYCELVKSITIPEGVTTIGADAFTFCQSLFSITLPSSVTSVGRSIECPLLYRIYGEPGSYAETWAETHGYVFTPLSEKGDTYTTDEYTYEVKNGYAAITGYMGSLTEVVIPSQLGGIQVTRIDDCAFKNCSSLENVTISEGITSIGEEAFSSCKSLKIISIPASVQDMAETAFDHCTSLVAINVAIDNSTYKSVDGVLFSTDISEIIYYPRGKADTEYTVPNGVKKIGICAFQNCTRLTNIELSDSVTMIEQAAFFNCTALVSITIPDGLESIGDSAFSSCTSLKSITLPDSLTSISGGAFTYCNALKSIKIPDGIKYIEPYTFAWCDSLESVTIGRDTKISDEAFIDCKSLTKVYGYAGSYAETWAKEKGRTFEIIKEEPNPEPPSFTDVPSDAWYTPYVEFAVSHSLFKGTSETTFSPDMAMSRAMFVQLFANLDGVNLSGYTSTPFSDAPLSSWYGPAVAWAAQNGVVNGTSPTTFAPDDEITREQMCVLIVNYAEYKGISLNETKTVTFSDAADISGWARDAVEVCANAGIINGAGDGTFNPSGTASRAEVATLMANFCRIVLDMA